MKTKITFPLALFLITFLSVSLPGQGKEGKDYVWWEGENPIKTNFPKKSWFSATTFKKNAHRLSEGKWLANHGKRKGPEAYALYEIEIPRSGRYNFWVRKFWKHGPFKWRFDQRKWKTCGRQIGLADSTYLRKHVVANWVKLGQVRLSKGSHRFELRLLAGPGESLTACFDCFLLTPHPFTPRGKLKPGEKSGLAKKGFWAFEPSRDKFRPTPLDMSHLNEEEAGQRGFVDKRGDDFVLGNGKKVRFWGVNAGPGILKLDRKSLRYLARKLAKMGVNMVRYHGPLFASKRNPSRLDSKRLDQLHYLIYLLKKEGIYTKISFYFPLWFPIEKSYGIKGYEKNKNKKPFSLLYFNRKMQKIYLSWLKELFRSRNPYTKRRLSREPAVAIVELINEDSFLFWTFKKGTIPRWQWEKLEKIYSKWLVGKYGSLARAYQSWGPGGKGKGDSSSKARLFDVWHMTARGFGRGGKKRRMMDQVEFLVRYQKKFYEKVARYCRKTLSVKSLLSCSNWKTADSRVLGPLERFTYTAGDVIDRHGYFGGKHQGKRASYQVNEGDRFENRSGLLEPASLPISVIQVTNFPQIISEIGWTNPNRYKAEFPFLCASYGALQDLDGFFFFALQGADWESSVHKFPLAIPSIMGQFPGLALLYRRGDVKEAPLALRESLSARKLFRLKGSALQEPQNLDALRKAKIPKGGVRRGGEVKTLDPFAFYVGKVERSFWPRRHTAFQRDLQPYINRKEKVITSLTKELAWDYGRGLAYIKTPRSQGVCGFLSKKKVIDLGEVTLQCENEYASFLAISLDDRPLKTSDKILLQMVTYSRPYGWKVEGKKIKNLGGLPLNVKENKCQVKLKVRGKMKKISFLDSRGQKKKDFLLKSENGKFQFNFPSRSLYVIVEKRP